jgi:sugar-specific transcriptional regulator TrmB
LGLVRNICKYPLKYQTKKPEEAAGFLIDLIRQGFTGVQSESKKQLRLGFIQNRKELLALTNKDTRQAKESLNIVVSGHEVPAETILAQKHAADRGVRVKMLIQDLIASSKERIRAWQKMGIEIRYIKYMQARILVFDRKIVYFTSYSEDKNHEAIGMRFEYEPYARLMNELFEQKWSEGKEF